jgi:hypothetical protein
MPAVDPRPTTGTVAGRGIRPDTDFKVLAGTRSTVPASACRFGATMNDYEVTYSNGVVVEVEAWAPEVAAVIAEEDAELKGWSGLSVVSVTLLTSQPVEE